MNDNIIYDFITSMYFAGMTFKYMIPLSRAKEPEIFRRFWLFLRDGIIGHRSNGEAC